MRVASLTSVYNAKPFIEPFLEQIKVFDENIFLLGEEPFEDYLAAGFVKKEKDGTAEILANHPVTVVKHNVKFYSGELFNKGLDAAKKLNCDVVVKIDPDMFLEKKSMDMLLEAARNLTQPALILDMNSQTMVYEEDFEHGISQSFWHTGGEPFVIRTDARFAEDGTNMFVEGASMLNLPADFMIHHFSGFRRNIVRETELKPNFPGWTPCPQEIQDLFNAKNRLERKQPSEDTQLT